MSNEPKWLTTHHFFTGRGMTDPQIFTGHTRLTRGRGLSFFRTFTASTSSRKDFQLYNTFTNNSFTEISSPKLLAPVLAHQSFDMCWNFLAFIFLMSFTWKLLTLQKFLYWISNSVLHSGLVNEGIINFSSTKKE